MTKEIQLSQGKVALVDDKDFEELNKYKWCAACRRGGWYAERGIYFENGKHYNIKMHRQITGIKTGIVDHKNGNGLDNRKENLRLCDHSQNAKNHKKCKRNVSGFTGVSWRKGMRIWQAIVYHNYNRIHLGYFLDKTEAARVVDKKAKELFGDFARLNIQEE